MENALIKACFVIFLLFPGYLSYSQNPYPNLDANAYLLKVVPKEVLTYLNDNYPAAARVSRVYNIPADFLLCVAGLETGWGKSELARNAFNHFGIKNHRREGPSYWIMHVDYVPGVGDVEEFECFRRYGSVLESFMDYARHLLQQACYQEIRDGVFSGFNDWAQVVSFCGYATDPEYGQKLRGIRSRYFVDFLIPASPSYTYNSAR